ncbi:MAG: glycine betaine ABC transporter substrate-binding protein, partial [Gemmataceae bacterium]
FNLGATVVVFEGLRSGDIDLYPEYTGTGWAIHLKIKERVSDPLQAYLIVAQRMKQEFDIVWLMPFGFANSFALAMSEESADRYNVRSISELVPYQDELTIGVSPQFFERADGYRGLSKAYDLDIGDVKVMDHGLAYEAIGAGKIDLVDTWTTDGKFKKLKMKLLEDDRKFFPPYDAAPIIRAETLKRYPELADVLNKLAFTISNEKMQEMNYRIEEEKESFASVARSFLAEVGVVQNAGPTVRRSSNFFAFLWSRRLITLQLGLQHLWLTGIAVGLAIFFSVPVGILLTRWPAAAGFVLGVAGVIQTIPSLALLAFMLPFLGLGAESAIAALFLYALLPIIRNTYTGIMEVDGLLLEAARGIGLKDRQILWRVQLPLATRTIMAGVRTSTVISVGVATLAAFIGAGGLGVPIVTGLQLNDQNWILSGAVPAALLALIIDFGLGRVETAVMPRGLS